MRATAKTQLGSWNSIPVCSGWWGPNYRGCLLLLSREYKQGVRLKVEQPVLEQVLTEEQAGFFFLKKYFFR